MRVEYWIFLRKIKRHVAVKPYTSNLLALKEKNDKPILARQWCVMYASQAAESLMWNMKEGNNDQMLIATTARKEKLLH